MPYQPEEFPLELRQYRCDGSHGLTHTRFVRDTDPDGTLIELTVEFCADAVCAVFVRTTCHHTSNSWHYVPGYEALPPDVVENEPSSALLCDFCGKDGT